VILRLLLTPVEHYRFDQTEPEILSWFSTNAGLLGVRSAESSTINV
jgi:hypothetical protein